MNADEARGIGWGLRQPRDRDRAGVAGEDRRGRKMLADAGEDRALDLLALGGRFDDEVGGSEGAMVGDGGDAAEQRIGVALAHFLFRHQTAERLGDPRLPRFGARDVDRSEEHTSELQSLMRSSYAVFCLKNKNLSSLNSLAIY